jgi:HSP20 family protein
MSIARLFPEFRALDRFDTLSDQWFNNARQFVTKPEMDLSETKNSFVMKADVPGFSKDQIEIDVTDSTLTIKGHYKKTNEKDTDSHHHTKERRESSFQRSFTLPMTVPADKLEASLKDGVLELVIPKSLQKATKVAIN